MRKYNVRIQIRNSSSVLIQTDVVADSAGEAYERVSARVAAWIPRGDQIVLYLGTA